MILLTFQKTPADGFVVAETGRLIRKLMQLFKRKKDSGFSRISTSEVVRNEWILDLL